MVKFTAPFESFTESTLKVDQVILNGTCFLLPFMITDAIKLITSLIHTVLGSTIFEFLLNIICKSNIRKRQR